MGQYATTRTASAPAGAADTSTTRPARATAHAVNLDRRPELAVKAAAVAVVAAGGAGIGVAEEVLHIAQWAPSSRAAVAAAWRRLCGETWSAAGRPGYPGEPAGHVPDARLTQSTGNAVGVTKAGRSRWRVR